MKIVRMNKRIQKVSSYIKLLIEKLISPVIRENTYCSKQIKPDTDSKKIFGRDDELDDIDDLFKKTSALAITGSRGIGKTTVASMYVDEVDKRKKFSKIYWRKMYETTDIIDIAGCFLNAIGKCNKEPRDYDTEDILNKLYTELNNKPYFLVLDNFQVLPYLSTNLPRKPGFSDLIEKASTNEIGSSKILFTSWACPESDKGTKPDCYTIEGLDKSAGKDLLKLRLPENTYKEELDMPVDLTGGHPLALKLLTSLLVNQEADDPKKILNEIARYKKKGGEVVTKIMDMVYERLSEEERKVLQFISVYRMPIPIEAIVTVATDLFYQTPIIEKKNLIKDTAVELIEKSLLQKTEVNNYWEESLINNYAYDKLDNKNEAHRLAYKSYVSIFFDTGYEKTTYHQYFVEAAYHLIKSNKKITNKDIEYFMNLPKEDTYLFFIINEIIQSNEIENTDKIFELIEGYIESKDPKIITSFLLSYGHYFENIYQIDDKKSFAVYHDILKLKEFNGDKKVLEAIANSVSSFANFHPDECLKIWQKLAYVNEDLTEAVVFYISNVDFSYLFNWDNVPGSESEKLRRFLVDNFDVNWVATAKICKSSDYKYLFSWGKIPGNDNVRLIEYLNRHFTIEWVKTAEIEKIDGGRTIKVSTGNKSLSLSLNDEKTKVNLKIDGNRTYEFIAKNENSMLNIYMDYKTILISNEEYLFSWNGTTGNDYNGLINFLNQNYDIEWVKTAKIEKNEDGNAIRVFTSNNFLSLELNDKKTNLNLKIDDIRTDEFIVKAVNGKLNIYEENSAKIVISEKNEKATLKLSDGRIHDLKIKIENGKLNIYSDIYLFTWKSVLGNNSKRLRGFIKDTFDIDWVATAKICESNDKTILISNDENSVTIVIDDKNKNAILKLNNNLAYDLNVKLENGKLNIYADLLSMKYIDFLSSFLDQTYQNVSFTTIQRIKIIFRQWGIKKDTEYLFNWGKIPGNDNVRLIEYLNRHFTIEWVKTAEIEKIDGGRTIKVSTGNKSLSLSLNDEKTKVNLKIDDNRTYEFIAKKENSMLNIYDTDIPSIKDRLSQIRILKKEYLFSWEIIPGNGNGRLLEILMQNFSIEWVKAAKINKNDDGKTIRLTNGTNFLSLTLNNEKTNVNLEIDDGRTDEFIVKTENSELNIYKKDKHIQYIERNYKKMNPAFTLEILSKCIEDDSTRINACELISKVVEYHAQNGQMMIIQASEILHESIKKEEDLKCIKCFIENKNDDDNKLYTLLVGIQTLDLLSSLFKEEVLLEYLKPVIEHKNITIKKLAKVTKKIIESNTKNRGLKPKAHEYFQILRVCINPGNFISMLQSELFLNTPFVMAVWMWATKKTAENHDVFEIRDVCSSAISKKNSPVLDASVCLHNRLQAKPTKYIKLIYKYAYKSQQIQVKFGSVALFIFMGDKEPEIINKCFEKIIADDNEYLVLFILEYLRLYTKQDMNVRNSMLELLINHDNPDISGFSDFLLNGI